MADIASPLFDFAAEAGCYTDTVGQIREFASHAAFRSAMVEELVLDEDFHRRPVRPEDLSFIDFRQPAAAETVTRLPFLAAQRLLLSINELKIARLPRSPDPAAFAACSAFYGSRNQRLGAAIRPFLEAFSFDFLDRDVAVTGVAAEMTAHIANVVRTEASRWGRIVASLDHADYLVDGLRFILIQNWSLAPSKRIALSGAQALGFFDVLPTDSRPSLTHDAYPDGGAAQLAQACGITRREHSYWQFYLSTSLASCNLLHCFAGRPDRALQLCGAAFAAEAEWLAFGCLVGQGAARLGLAAADLGGLDVDAAMQDLAGRFGRAVTAVAGHYGSHGLRQVAQGLNATEVLGRSARQNLDAQLRWLASVERYRSIAQAIDARIQAERPDIDRETFVEPREMCSTTHVHDDHRLVVIESGDMVFWGNLGMTLRLRQGEMVLVPQGRLHGSSIESAECTYHQPIIPDEWIEPLLNDAHRPFAAP
ncbi:MAG TPA: hypothetical protein VGC09_18270 [Rhodopila sp.]